jgi:lipid-binding SYLF domain-containing protein
MADAMPRSRRKSKGRRPDCSAEEHEHLRREAFPQMKVLKRLTTAATVPGFIEPKILASLAPWRLDPFSHLQTGFGTSSAYGSPMRLQPTRRPFQVCGLLFLLLLTPLTSCYRDAAVSKGGASSEQVIVDRARASIERFRSSGEFPALADYLSRAKAVMIFPRVVKAALVFGGEGGTGVLVARDKLGKWGAPAFYGLGGGSAGLQLGYQEASIVLVFMSASALLSVIDRGLTLGADASVAAGTVGDDVGAAKSARTGKDVYAFVDVGGVFAGISLDGTVLAAREELNRNYYGAGATAHAIVIERRFDNPATTSLRVALSGG